MFNLELRYTYIRDIVEAVISLTEKKRVCVFRIYGKQEAHMGVSYKKLWNNNFQKYR